MGTLLRSLVVIVGGLFSLFSLASECELLEKKEDIKACHAMRLDKQPLFSASLIAYKPNYFMLMSHNAMRAEQSSQSMPDGIIADNTEGKFQFSFKHAVADDLFGSGVDFWFAYTQQSFWQLYNTDNSSPFRESNYEPEAWFERRFLHLNYQGWRLDKISFGINHQSNGRSGDFSRSWNRMVLSAAVHREWSNERTLAVELRTWRRLRESLDDDDNPDLTEYMGHGEVILAYKHQRHQVSLAIRNLFSGDSHQGVSLDYSHPLPWNDRVLGYIQFTGGYGESLIDYNLQNNTISIGVAIAHWL